MGFAVRLSLILLMLMRSGIAPCAEVLHSTEGERRIEEFVTQNYYLYQKALLENQQSKASDHQRELEKNYLAYKREQLEKGLKALRDDGVAIDLDIDQIKPEEDPSVVTDRLVRNYKKSFCAGEPERKKKRRAACVPSDLRNRWPPHSIQDQGFFGACHTFATVALAEAEVFNTTKEYVKFSEADLFLGHMADGDESVSPEKRARKHAAAAVAKAVKAKNSCTADELELFDEGASIKSDLDRMLNKGAVYSRTLTSLSGRDGKGNLYDETKTVFAAIETLRKLRLGIEDWQKRSLAQPKPPGNFGDLFSEMEGIFRKLGESYDYESSATRGARADVAKLLKGLGSPKINQEHFNTPSLPIQSSLESGRPVLITLSNYASTVKANYNSSLQSRKESAFGDPSCDNGPKPPPHAEGIHDSSHAVVIAGYDCETDEYLIRNSWKGRYAHPGDDGYERIPRTLLKDPILTTWGAQTPKK